MATLSPVRQPPLKRRVTPLETIPRAWRMRAALLLGGLLVVAALVGFASLWAHRETAAPPAPAPAAPVAAPAPQLTAGQLTTALARSTLAPNSVNLELTYAPPIFFEVTGKPAPKAGTLAAFLQEDTHIDALDSTPARFYFVIDGQGQYFPTQGTILSDSGHHRLSSFVFEQDGLPQPQRELTAVFPFANGTQASVTWSLPLQLGDGTSVAAAAGAQDADPIVVTPDELATVQLSALNTVLRKVQSNVTYGGVRDAELAVTYATPEYFKAALSPEATRRYTPETNAVFLVSETSHTADLPAQLPPLTLRYQGQTYAPDLVEPTVASSHHRVTMVRFPVNPGQTLTKFLGSLDLQLPDDSRLTWGLPIAYTGAGSQATFGVNAASILSLVGGMLAAMWPCLFQLTVFFIPALAGVSMEEASAAVGVRRRFRVIKAALFFILGFTIVYTAAGALVGFVVQQFGSAPEFDTWQRYIGIAAGLAIIVLALRTAAKVRAPLVCKMPVLSKMAHGRKASSPIELMLAGLAFATGCMTCFGAALIIAMVVYVGMAGSAWVGGMTLFLFSMGMGIPLVIAAAAMSRVLPMLSKLERITPWMGLASSLVMIGFAIMLITGNYMAFTAWLLERL